MLKGVVRSLRKERDYLQHNFRIKLFKFFSFMLYIVAYEYLYKIVDFKIYYALSKMAKCINLLYICN